MQLVQQDSRTSSVKHTAQEPALQQTQAESKYSMTLLSVSGIPFLCGITIVLFLSVNIFQLVFH